MICQPCSYNKSIFIIKIIFMSKDKGYNNKKSQVIIQFIYSVYNKPSLLPAFYPAG